MPSWRRIIPKLIKAGWRRGAQRIVVPSDRTRAARPRRSITGLDSSGRGPGLAAERDFLAG